LYHGVGEAKGLGTEVGGGVQVPPELWPAAGFEQVPIERVG
jgi:hypothetical protein